jgi:hypothetical protein
MSPLKVSISLSARRAYSLAVTGSIARGLKHMSTGDDWRVVPFLAIRRTHIRAEVYMYVKARSLILSMTASMGSMKAVERSRAS